MLLHLSPRVYWPYKNAVIVDLESETLGLHLVGGVDLITGHPYPNKGWAIACPKTRTRKAFTGLLIETSSPVEQWHMTARWGMKDTDLMFTHQVDYRLLDRDFDTVSEDSNVWHEMWEGTEDGVQRMVRPTKRVVCN